MPEGGGGAGSEVIAVRPMNAFEERSRCNDLLHLREDVWLQHSELKLLPAVDRCFDGMQPLVEHPLSKEKFEQVLVGYQNTRLARHQRRTGCNLGRMVTDFRTKYSFVASKGASDNTFPESVQHSSKCSALCEQVSPPEYMQFAAVFVSRMDR